MRPASRNTVSARQLSIRKVHKGVILGIPAALQRSLCALHKILDSGPEPARNSQNGHAWVAHAPSTGCAQIKSALPDDALPGMRGPHGVPRPPSDRRRYRRHRLCLPALRRRVDPHFGARGAGSHARRGLDRYTSGSRNCASAAQPSRPYGFASVSSISKWL
jgi:hypothetical protein